MSTRVTRRLAAGTLALALAGLGLVGIGAGAASAVDTIPADPTFGGTGYLYDANGGGPIAPGTVLPWDGGAAAPVFIGAPDDVNATVGLDPTTIGATEVYTFMSPQGSEGTMQKWNALSPQGMTANGQLQADLTPLDLLNQGLGTPSGQAAVKAAGGNYSLGLAYTKNNGVTVLKTFFVHITVAPGGSFSYQPVQATVVKTTTTTTLSSSASTVNTGQAFTLTAAVAPAAATGTVEFFDGTTSLGTAPVASGTATLATASLSTAGARSITAVYSGDSAYSGSTSAAVSVTANLAPITTTLAVSTTSADSTALHPVTLSASLTPAGATGTVVFTGSVNGGAAQNLGSAPVTGGNASITISGLTQGAWTIDAAFTGTGAYQPSASTTAATLTLAAAAYATATPADSNVTVAIPAGMLTITTPWTTATPLNLGTAVLDSASSTWSTPVTTFASASDQSKAIQVVDTRAGVPGFTAQVASTDFVNGPQKFTVSHMGLVNVAAHQVTGNAIQAADVVTSNVASLSSSAQTFAAYHPTSSTLGTAWISGDLDLKGVPTSVQPGTYTATLTFTAF